MADLRQAAQQALEALEQCGLNDTHRSYQFEHAARAALRAALAQQAEPVQEPAFHGFMSDDGTQVDVCFSPSAPRKDGTYATAYYTAPPQRPTEPVQGPEGMVEFLADLQRSRTKYPKNRRMFDGLMGEIDELRRAYAGDGDIRAEAFDVAVCAFRIATEGDAGGNARLEQAEAASADPHTTTLRNLLECCLSWESDACVLGNVTARQAVAALRAALAQEEPEHQPGCALLKIPSRDCDCRQEQEPVAWVDEASIAWLAEHPRGIVTTRLVSQKSPERQIPIYTHPPRREWQSLSEEEAKDLAGEDYIFGAIIEFARAIEAKLKEKNNE